MKKNNRPFRVAMIGHKRVPSREGGIEVVVWELATRLRDKGYEVECYNRSGYRMKHSDYDRIPGKHGGRGGSRSRIPQVRCGGSEKEAGGSSGSSGPGRTLPGEGGGFYLQQVQLG